MIQAWSTNNEQGFQMRMFGMEGLRVVDWEGVQLVEETKATQGEKAEVKKRRVSAGKNC